MAEIETTHKKQFKYRGKDIEELKALDTREVAKYLGARSRRTVLRNFQEIENFVARAEKKVAKGKKIKTHKRNIIVVPQMVGMNIQVHNGKNFIPERSRFHKILTPAAVTFRNRFSLSHLWLFLWP